MKRKIITYILFFFLFSSCDSYLMLTPTSSGASGSDEVTANVSGSPSEFSEQIYETADLSALCQEAGCLPEYDELSDDYREFYDTEAKEVCAFDEDPNLTSQFLLYHQSEGINGLNLRMSKEDLFFLAWASMRYQINPHFLLGVMSQESYGNCAAVSVADAEGCFQITNDYGRGQLEDSYGNRVEGWYWNENPGSYYSDSLFVDPVIWFGEEPQTDQFRMTLDPDSKTVLGMRVSSVVNFNFGVIASALFYRWEDYFLYYQYESLNDTTREIIADTEESKAVMLAAAYNGGAGRLANSLRVYKENYINGMATETQNYVANVASYCRSYQQGDSVYTANYTIEDVDYLVDLLAMTYSENNVNWDALKQDIADNFFATQEELSFVDDVKALVYYISVYDSQLAPEWPEV